MKNLFVLLCSILIAQSVTAQNTLDRIGLTNATPPAPSFSLRLLSNSYAGSAIQVRRSSDQATMDIGFMNGHLDTATLKSFVGANSGFVSIWYDQSGNDKDASQENPSLQPCIVLSGVVLNKNNFPTIYFNGSTKLSTIAYTDGYPGAFTLAICGGVKNNTSYSTLGNKTYNNLPSPWDVYNNNVLIGDGGTITSYSIPSPINSTTGFAQWIFQSNSSSSSSFINGSANGSGGAVVASDESYPSAIVLGSRSDGVTSLDGWLSEFVTFPSLLNNSDRQTIEGSQAAYFMASNITILEHPSTSTQNVARGSSASVLGVTAIGESLTYQWYKHYANSNTGGTLLSGETFNYYIPATSTLGTSYYYVVVSSTSGITTSNVSGAITVYTPTPTITGFNNLAKTLYDGSYTIIAPASNSTGLFTYNSSNNSVATINGNIVTINGAGIANITATQAADASFSSSSVTATLTVNAVTVITKHGEITTTNPDYINKNGALNRAGGLDASGKSIVAKSLGDGLTAATASTSAYAIKQAFPSSTDGYYWIANANINGGTPFKIYADMTTDGGGWTLILCNTAPNPGWNSTNALLRNELNPNPNNTYSIIGWADYIKKSSSGFQYMMDASTRGSNGGIWTANSPYSFVSTSNLNTNITLNTKFGNWNYSNDDIEERMPWHAPGRQGLITTSFDADGAWWGTLIANSGWNPAPWLGNSVQHPNVIWYWVR